MGRIGVLLTLFVCFHPELALARPVPKETINWSVATARNFDAEIRSNFDVRDVLSRLPPDQQRQAVITASAINIGHTPERELFVRISHRDLCDQTLCPMILMKGKSGGNETMAATDATKVRLLSVSRGGFRAFRVYRLGASYVDFYCGVDGQCSTPS